MRRAMRLILVVGLTVAAHHAAAGPDPLASAQDLPEPPALGSAVLEDPLTATGPLQAGACPSGRNTADFVPEGFRLRVTGRCTETATNASQLVFARGLIVADGEVAVEASAADAAERMRVSLHARVQENNDGYLLTWEPTRSRAELRKSVDQTVVLLAERGDLPIVPAGGWARLALRLDGDTLWGFVGDEPALSARDGAYSTGRVGIGIARLGSVDDKAPTAVVLRGLRAAGVAEGDAARLPTYAPPAVSPRTPPFVPPVGSPPEVGRTILERSLTQADTLPTVTCPTGRGGSRVVAEGFLISVQGRCVDTLQVALVAPPIAGLTLADGEISLDFKVMGGGDRAALIIQARVQRGPAGGLAAAGYGFAVFPNQGSAIILRHQAGQPQAVLAQRRDIGRLLRTDDWNTLSARLLGDALWLVVNGQPALSAQDGAFASGAAGVEVDRLGDANDEGEVAVVFRDLRVSTIAGAPDERAPTYEPPAQREMGPVVAARSDRAGR